MLKRIAEKLRGAAGASVIMALSVMMVVAALSASMLSIAVTAPQVAVTQQQEQQAYLAVTSTARLLQDILNTNPEKLNSLTSDTTGTSYTIKLMNDSSELIKANVKLENNTPESGITVTISAQGYTLENVKLTYIP